MIDCNTFIGHWPFRRLRQNDVVGLLGMMDQFGIERACAASADAVLFKDSHAGNERLFEETHGHEDRFWLYATLNPCYPGWQRDLAWCVDKGFRALRLYPIYHGYALSGREAGAIIDAAAEAGLPVSVPCRIEDLRQRHWMDVTENVDPLDVLAAAEAHPDADFLLMEAVLSPAGDSDTWRRFQDARVHLEMSRLSNFFGNSLKTALDMLGPDRVLLGTGFPFKTPSPAFLKIQALDADAGTKARITRTNAVHLFDKTS